MKASEPKKTVLVTGSTDGIGRQTASDLAARGATVIIHGRDENRCRAVAESLSDADGRPAPFVTADFRSLHQIQQMAEIIHQRVDRLDVLINNAGVYRNRRNLTEDGFEETLAVNHLAPFALTLLLLDLLRHSDQGRIITVSSMIHAHSLDFDNLQGEVNFSGSEAYSQSKLCNILFTFELADRLRSISVTANCLHPGVINTKLLRAAWSGGAPVSRGAETPVYLALDPGLTGVTGRYIVDRRTATPAQIAQDTRIRHKLWDVSERMTGVRWETPF